MSDFVVVGSSMGSEQTAETSEIEAIWRKSDVEYSSGFTSMLRGGPLQSNLGALLGTQNLSCASDDVVDDVRLLHMLPY
jgi:putative AlgH/UPF0301 family transcriptional regulator